MSDLFNYVPQKIDKLFSEDQYQTIYNYVNSVLKDDMKPGELEGDGFRNFSDVGYYGVFGFDDQEVLDVIHAAAEKLSGLKLEKDFQLHFARYTTKTGHVPRLRPHSDMMLKKETLTLSVQLDKNIDWLLFANGEEVALESNQALLFSGSHQIHWRPKREFSDGEFLDIIVCQLPLVNGESLPEGHGDLMYKIRERFLDSYGSMLD